MKPIAIYDATVPVACTASSAELEERIEQIERLRDDLTLVERTEHGVRLQFPNRSHVEERARAFAVAEKACCAFWGFDLAVTRDTVTLRWDGPPEVRDLLERLVTWLDGDEPLPAGSALL